MVQNKINMVAFNLQDALNGKKVVNRIGQPVRVITATSDGKILAVTEVGVASRREAEKYNMDGSKFNANSEHYKDLFMVA